MSRAIFFRAAGLIFPFFGAGVGTGAEVAADLGGRPRLFGAVPSRDWTWRMCCSRVLFFASKPARAAVRISFGMADDCGMLSPSYIKQKAAGMFEFGFRLGLYVDLLTASAVVPLVQSHAVYPCRLTGQIRM
jgi:hypothetical protein